MKVITLFNKEELPNEQENILNIQIPTEWWDSNYSCNFGIKRSAIIHKLKKREYTKIPKTPGWDLLKGDYHVKERQVNTLDYIYNRNFRIRIIKYSLYLIIAVTIILTTIVSNILSLF